LHAFERSAYHFPGLVEVLAHFLVGGEHARLVDRLRPAGLAIEGGSAEIKFVRGHLVALACELFGDFLIAFGDAGPLDDPGLQIEGLHPLRHFERIGIAGVDRLREANLELPASRQTFSGIEFLFRTPANGALLACFRARILCQGGGTKCTGQRGKSRGRQAHLDQTSPTYVQQRIHRLASFNKKVEFRGNRSPSRGMHLWTAPYWKRVSTSLRPAQKTSTLYVRRRAATQKIYKTA